MAHRDEEWEWYSSPVEQNVSSSQKFRNDYYRCLHLSETSEGERENEAKWLVGGPQTEVGFPSPRQFLTSLVDSHFTGQKLRHERPESL